MEKGAQSVVTWLLLAAVILLISLNTWNVGIVDRPVAGGLGPDVLREYAGKLKSKGLKEEAAAAYEAYLRVADLQADGRSNVCFTIASLYMEAQEYEKALAWFYLIQTLSPKADIADRAGPKIIACLENLGRHADARYELNRETAVDKDTQTDAQTGTVLAVIGNRKITLREINDIIQTMPEPMQKQYKNADMKKKLLQQYVLIEALAEKARRHGMEKDPLYRKGVEYARKNLLVSLYMEKKISEMVNITPQDVELYYKANTQMFSDPRRTKVAHILFDNKHKAEKILKILNVSVKDKTFSELAREHSLDRKTAQSGGVIPGYITEKTDIPGINDEKDFRRAVNNTAPGEVAADVVRTDQGYHVIKVLERKEQREKSFDEVKDDAARKLRMERESMARRKIYDEARSVKKITIYEDRIE